MKNNLSLKTACLAMLILWGVSAYAQETLEMYPGQTHQEVVGFGGSLAYYEGWVTAHQKKSEIYEAIFGELSLDILRVRNAYVYDPSMIGKVREFMTAAENSLGHPIKLLSTSWGPTDTLKSNGDRKNGGSLRYEIVDGKVIFDYEGFAQWWDASLDEYDASGVYPDYISFQNEPDFSADWESCRFSPAEVITASDTFASYSKGLDAIYNMVQAREKKPLILGPETVGIGYNSVQNYVNALDVSKLDGIAHHLYHGVDENNPYASSNFTAVGNLHPEIPHFQTEYSRGDWFSLGGLIYKSFYDEKVVSYMYWDLVWPDKGLVSIQNPWQSSSYTKTKEFYAFKQFSAFIHPGWHMVDQTVSGSNTASLTFVSPDKDSAVCVIINRSSVEELDMEIKVPGYRIAESAIYTTSETKNCENSGSLLLPDSSVHLAAYSITTVDMRLEAYDPSEDHEAPDVPSGLEIAEYGEESLLLTWLPSGDHLDVDGYRVFLEGLEHTTTADTFMLFTGLVPNTSYNFQVSAYDTIGNESALSEEFSATTLYFDTEPPVLSCTDSLYQGGNIRMKSSEDGWVFLTPDGTSKLLSEIRAASLDSLEVKADITAVKTISGLENGIYLLYAIDSADNVSDPASLGIHGVSTWALSAISDLLIYPNPMHSSVSISFRLDKAGPVDLFVYDMQGKVLLRKDLGTLEEGQQQVSMQRAGLRNGSYMLRITDDRGAGSTFILLVRD